MLKRRRLRRPSPALYLACVFPARSASVSHLSAISMKRDLCCEVRAASANRMHSAALLRNWSKLGKSASIVIHMGNECAVGSAALKISFECSRQVEVGHEALYDGVAFILVTAPSVVI